jgi:hypothetical protein
VVANIFCRDKGYRAAGQTLADDAARATSLIVATPIAVSK